MEAMVYQDSPLASYLEAEGTASSHGDDVLTTTAIPHRDPDDSDAGDSRSDDDDYDDDDDERSDRDKVDFAPSNNVALDKQIRDHLPQPLALQPFPFLRYPSLAAVLDAFRSLLTVSLSEADNKRFLEQLGYKIVASQLLNEQSPPSYATAASILANAPTQHEVSESTSHSLVAAGLSAKGALLAPAVSFCLVYLVNWLLLTSSSTETETATSSGTRGRRRSSVTTISLTTRETTAPASTSPAVRTLAPLNTLLRYLTALVSSACLTCGLYSLCRRHYLRHLRRYAIDVTGVLVSNSHSYDSAASASLVLIQEVELVSRGYRLSHPLPPISRLESHGQGQQNQRKRCLRLRRALARTSADLLHAFWDARLALETLVDPAELEKYHDIYDYAPDDDEHLSHSLRASSLARSETARLADHVDDADDAAFDDDPEQTSLRSLRLLFASLYAARKGLLCCLLAIPARGGDADIEVWGVVTDRLQALASQTGAALVRLTDILREQDGDLPEGSGGEGNRVSPDRPIDLGKARNRAQLRRLNALSQGIRNLHAKMNLVREESEAYFAGDSRSAPQSPQSPQVGAFPNAVADDAEFNAALTAMYDSIGTDLRALIQEWEVGKATLQQQQQQQQQQQSQSTTNAPLRHHASNHGLGISGPSLGHRRHFSSSSITHSPSASASASASSSSIATSVDGFWGKKSVSRPPSGKWNFAPPLPVALPENRPGVAHAATAPASARDGAGREPGSPTAMSVSGLSGSTVVDNGNARNNENAPGDNGNGNGNVITTSTTPIPPKHLESTLRILTGNIDGNNSNNSNNNNTSTPPPRNTDSLDYCPSPDINLDDDEVFDAMNTPLKINRKRLSMSREERIARVKGERARMAARARPDGNAGGNANGASTSMLRELETVIKLRPQHGSGGGSGAAAGAEGNVNGNANVTPPPVGGELWRRHKKGRTSI